MNDGIPAACRRGHERSERGSLTRFALAGVEAAHELFRGGKVPRCSRSRERAAMIVVNGVRYKRQALRLSDCAARLKSNEYVSACSQPLSKP
jgi:hypothetical protein